MSVHASTGGAGMTPEVNAAVRRWLIKGYVGVLFTAAMLFIPAWRLDWVMGWVYVAMWLLWHSALALILIPTNPELLAERARAQKGTKSWDLKLVSFAGLASARTLDLIELALATPVVLWGAWPFFVRGWRSVVTWNLNMFTLIGLGVGVSYVYSVVAAFFPELFPASFRNG